MKRNRESEGPCVKISLERSATEKKAVTAQAI